MIPVCVVGFVTIVSVVASLVLWLLYSQASGGEKFYTDLAEAYCKQLDKVMADLATANELLDVVGGELKAAKAACGAHLADANKLSKCLTELEQKRNDEFEAAKSMLEAAQRGNWRLTKLVEAIDTQLDVYHNET